METMKKIYYSLLLVISLIFVANAQNEVDALRYSQILPSGTARYTAMGGAFGALGADLSVMASNLQTSTQVPQPIQSSARS